MKVTPKDFFLWAGAMVALYGGIISFITLLFQYINYAYPDPLAYYVEPYSSGIRFSMAALIVLAPVALILMRLIRRDMAKMAEKKDIWVRRWALMLTLFIAGASIVIDLITLLNAFLGGDLTMPFVLKVVTVLLVAAAVFMHFIADVKGYWNQYPGRARSVSLGVAVAVVAAIVSGFFIMGTPGEVRLYRYDTEKASDLQNIQYQVVNYWQQKEALPDTIDQLEDPLSGWTSPRDPQTGDMYEYEKTGDLSFRLCATFNAESQGLSQSEAMPVRAYGTLEGNFQHGAGRECFDRTIDPDRYPVFEKTIPTAVR